MLRYRYDQRHAFAVMVLSPPASDTDIDEYVACVKTLDAVAANREGAALVMVLDDGYPLPSGDALALASAVRTSGGVDVRGGGRVHRGEAGRGEAAPPSPLRRRAEGAGAVPLEALGRGLFPLPRV